MFGLFKKDPAKKLEKEYERLMERARDMQRSGDLRAYAVLIEESETILSKIDKLEEMSRFMLERVKS